MAPRESESESEHIACIVIDVHILFFYENYMRLLLLYESSIIHSLHYHHFPPVHQPIGTHSRLKLVLDLFLLSSMGNPNRALFQFHTLSEKESISS